MFLDAALALAARGFRIHPLIPNEKRPKLQSWPSRASTEEKAIRGWWRQCPDYNIGIATGNGIIVLDVDDPTSLEDLQRAHGMLPPTLTAQTPRGGWHVYLKLPAGLEVRNRTNCPLPGLDIRGDGGYVVAPPSFAKAPYEWAHEAEIGDAPTWLLELLSRPEHTPVGEIELPPTDERLRRARSYLATMPGGVSGDHGHDRTWKAALLVVRGFALPAEDAFALLAKEFNPRCTPPWSDAELRHKVEDALAHGRTPMGYKMSASAPDQAEYEAESAPPPLELFKGGTDTVQLSGLSKSLASACRVLRRKDLCASLLGSADLELNMMGHSIEAGRKTISEVDMVSFRERAEIVLRGVMGGKAKTIIFSKDTVQDAFLSVASERPYHPVREYLSSLGPFQQGEPGIGYVGDILHFQPNSLQRTILRRWAVGAVRRAMEPGCQHKNVLILVGAQDAGKSKLFRSLAGDSWFADTDMDLRNKDSYQQLQTAWVYEWSELSSIRTSTEDRTKAFISSARDTYRAPFARLVEAHPRSTVIVGSSNRDDILFDPTGSVRLWPVRVPNVIDLDGIEHARDSFWAEAFSAYQASEPHWLTEDGQRAELVNHQKEFNQEDPWVERLQEWLNPGGVPRKEVVTARLAAEGALKLQPSDMNSGTDRRVSVALRAAGWEREQYANTRLGDPRWGQRVRAWHPVDCGCVGGTHVCGKSNGA